MARGMDRRESDAARGTPPRRDPSATLERVFLRVLKTIGVLTLVLVGVAILLNGSAWGAFVLLGAAAALFGPEGRKRWDGDEFEP